MQEVWEECMFGIGNKQERAWNNAVFAEAQEVFIHWCLVSTFWLSLWEISSKSSWTLDARLKWGKVHRIAWLWTVLNKVYSKRMQFKKKEKQHRLNNFKINPMHANKVSAGIFYTFLLQNSNWVPLKHD